MSVSLQCNLEKNDLNINYLRESINATLGVLYVYIAYYLKFIGKTTPLVFGINDIFVSAIFDFGLW